MVLDVGANVECDAQQLVDFAIMGEAFARANTGAGRARLFVLGVGDDAATTLLGRLAAAGDGYFGHVREGSDIAFLLLTTGRALAVRGEASG